MKMLMSAVLLVILIAVLGNIFAIDPKREEANRIAIETLGHPPNCGCSGATPEYPFCPVHHKDWIEISDWEYALLHSDLHKDEKKKSNSK